MDQSCFLSIIYGDEKAAQASPEVIHV